MLSDMYSKIKLLDYVMYDKRVYRLIGRTPFKVNSLHIELIAPKATNEYECRWVAYKDITLITEAVKVLYGV